MKQDQTLTSSANDRQVGGSHYQNGGEQHWDRAARLGLNYFEAAATKYIERSRQKNGRQDIKKAIHYLQKLDELIAAGLLPEYDDPLNFAVSEYVNQEPTGILANATPASFMGAPVERLEPAQGTTPEPQAAMHSVELAEKPDNGTPTANPEELAAYARAAAYAKGTKVFRLTHYQLRHPDEAARNSVEQMEYTAAMNAYAKHTEKFKNQDQPATAFITWYFDIYSKEQNNAIIDYTA